MTFTANRPVTLRVDGGSYTTGLTNKPNQGIVGGLQSLNATCSHDLATDTLRVDERGRSVAKVMQSPIIKKEGRFVLDGTSAVLAASLPLRDVEITHRDGWWGPVCEYKFTLPLDGTNESVALSYSMDDEDNYLDVRGKVGAASAAAEVDKQIKTDKMNGLLNDVVPYFRCSDHDVVKIYYFLWSVYLMLYIDVGQGLESYPHTQSAANNFLGMHRFDAVFQVSYCGSRSDEVRRHEFGALTPSMRFAFCRFVSELGPTRICTSFTPTAMSLFGRTCTDAD